MENNLNPSAQEKGSRIAFLLSVLHDIDRHSFCLLTSMQLMHTILNGNKRNGNAKFNLTPTVHNQVQISVIQTNLCNTVGPPQQ